eukprot:311159-Pelagomonas_calceolata.AAC.4
MGLPPRPSPSARPRAALPPQTGCSSPSWAAVGTQYRALGASPQWVQCVGQVCRKAHSFNYAEAFVTARPLHNGKEACDSTEGCLAGSC